MRLTITPVLLVAAIAGVVVSAQDAARAVSNADWEFSEEFGRSPSRWAYILNETSGAPMWPLCRSGNEQSPADIRQAAVVEGLRRAVNTWVDSNNYSVTNDGVRIRVVPQDVDPSFVHPVTGEATTLRYIGVAVPGGHRSGGSSADMELHFVHGVGSNVAAAVANSDDAPAAVVSVPFIAGAADNEELQAWVPSIPPPPPRDAATGAVAAVPRQTTVRQSLRVNALLPPVVRDYVAYDGSELNPPCRQGVKHMVFTEPLRMSYAQLATIRSRLHINGALQDGWPVRAARASRGAVTPQSPDWNNQRYVLPRDDVSAAAPPQVEAVTTEAIIALLALSLGSVVALAAITMLLVAWCYPRVPSA